MTAAICRIILSLSAIVAGAILLLARDAPLEASSVVVVGATSTATATTTATSTATTATSTATSTPTSTSTPAGSTTPTRAHAVRSATPTPTNTVAATATTAPPTRPPASFPPAAPIAASPAGGLGPAVIQAPNAGTGPGGNGADTLPLVAGTLLIVSGVGSLALGLRGRR